MTPEYAEMRAVEVEERLSEGLSFSSNFRTTHIRGGVSVTFRDLRSILTHQPDKGRTRPIVSPCGPTWPYVDVSGGLFEGLSFATPPRREGAVREPPRGVVMALRYLAGETMGAIGQDYGLTRERVRQLLKREGITWRQTRSVRMRGRALDPTDPRFTRIAHGRRPDLKWATFRANGPKRRRIILRIRKLMAEVGRTPTLYEIADVFGYDPRGVYWQLGILFLGKTNGAGTRKGALTNAWRRIRRLTGMAYRGPGQRADAALMPITPARGEGER